MQILYFMDFILPQYPKVVNKVFKYITENRFNPEENIRSDIKKKKF